MNVLSLGANFGALVWVFQDGHLSGLLGFDPRHGRHHRTGADLRVRLRPVHGLRVFLLSRIKEAWDQTGDNDRRSPSACSAPAGSSPRRP